MRLVDADKLIEQLNKNSIFRTVTNAEGKSAIEIIEEQPTAFDVDKVVEQLKEESILAEKKVVVCLDDALEIVKDGGIDVLEI